MNKILDHLTYKGSVDFDIDSEVLHGKVLFIKDLITYEGTTLAELKAAFIEGVDDYLSDCKEDGVEPCKTFSGTLQIRIPPSMHQDVALEAHKENISSNAWINEAIKEKLANNSHTMGELKEILHDGIRYRYQATFNLPMQNTWDRDETQKPQLRVVK